MRIVVQRCSSAEVRIDGQVVGRIGADMKVDFVNDGPVTILLDSAEL